MIKQVLFCAVFITSIQLCAMENTHVVHVPKISDQENKLINDYIKETETSVAEHTLSGAVYGGMGPWVVTGGAGALALGCLPKGDSLVLTAVGGWLGCFLFAIPNALLTIPSAIVGTGCGLANGVYQEIKEACTKEKRLRLIALRMYQMIYAVKEGRPLLRAELMNGDKHDSVIKTVEAKLSDKETFKKYFGETEFSYKQLQGFLSQIKPEYDNWENFFKGISQIMKIEELDDEQWQKLEHALINFKIKDKEFPGLSAEDIKEHLYVSAYYFARGAKVKWLKALIQ